MKNGKYYRNGQEILYLAGGFGINPKIEWAKGKRGIVFFKDFYPRDENRCDIVEGDHIDLWNGEIMTGANYTGEPIIGQPEDEERFDSQRYMANKLNYFNRAPEVWLWVL